MKTRLIQYEKNFSDKGTAYNKIQSVIVDFVCITGTQSAKVIYNGKLHTVRRKSLLDVPQYILYPDIPIVGRVNGDPENWKRSCYFD